MTLQTFVLQGPSISKSLGVSVAGVVTLLVRLKFLVLTITSLLLPEVKKYEEVFLIRRNSVSLVRT